MRRFGLIGKTLKHSFSQNYFTQKFARENITDCSYSNFELQSIDEVTTLVNTPGLAGFNITIPYKEEILPFLHKKNIIVEKIGACNCVKIIKGQLHGFNTDAIAFQKSLEKNIEKDHQSALVLGSGGASKAIQYALQQMNIEFIIVSRNAKINQLRYEDIRDDVLQKHQIIINTTPLGMYPNIDQCPPIPYHSLSTGHLLFDLTYNPEKTKFLLLGEAKGTKIMNGYEMLVLQAEESWRIWNE